LDELKGKRIAILVAEGFEDLEFFYPLLRFTEAGAEVVVAGLTKDEVKGKYGMEFTPPNTVQDIQDQSFDCVVIPGGDAPEKMRTSEDLLAFVKKSQESGVVVAAICHGPQVLVSAGLVEGRKLTAYRAVKDEIVEAGGLFDYVEVMRDGNIITSRFPEDLPAFSKAIIAALTA
jgi:protease I